MAEMLDTVHRHSLETYNVSETDDPPSETREF